jgi:hypothetical protein
VRHVRSHGEFTAHTAGPTCTPCMRYGRLRKLPGIPELHDGGSSRQPPTSSEDSDVLRYARLALYCARRRAATAMGLLQTPHMSNTPRLATGVHEGGARPMRAACRSTYAVGDEGQEGCGTDRSETCCSDLVRDEVFRSFDGARVGLW